MGVRLMTSRDPGGRSRRVGTQIITKWNDDIFLSFCLF